MALFDYCSRRYIRWRSLHPGEKKQVGRGVSPVGKNMEGHGLGEFFVIGAVWEAVEEFRGVTGGRTPALATQNGVQNDAPVLLDTALSCSGSSLPPTTQGRGLIELTDYFVCWVHFPSTPHIPSCLLHKRQYLLAKRSNNLNLGRADGEKRLQPLPAAGQHSRVRQECGM